MGYINRTVDFREALKSKQSTTPPPKRPKLTADADSKDTFGKQYLEEAYTILNHINTLTRMLANVRRPYLSMDLHASPLVRQGSRNLDLNDSQQLWSEVRYLSNEERDQIDLQARVILTRCADRVKEMEALEKRRAELAASSVNPLARFLPTRLVHGDSTMLSEYMAAHHSSMTWYLNRRLTEASQNQKELQEERVKRQLERTRTLGSSAAREAMTIGSRGIVQERQFTSDSWLGGASSAIVSGIAATIGSSSNRPAATSKSLGPTTSTEDTEDDEEEIELTQSQILQFEAENANILRSVQDTLESVQQAEARLMDISNLQMELVTHLTRQTELTDQLYEDAIATTSTVEKGNVQLREARRRAKDSRIFILIFLIGASLSLLFLHFY
ncbi:snare protein syntaxin 18/UFE1 [Gyrodon lividus]|nr:snare protein syntaxin 18/UFE1 [Gyrodon lividus]